MDLSPVFTAVPPLAVGMAILTLGLVCPAPVRAPAVRVGAVLTALVLAAALTCVGLGLAIHAWKTSPQTAWAVLVGSIGIVYLSAQRHSARRRRDLDDHEDDDDGGQPCAPAPSPAPPAPDWDAFDRARRGWDREPASVA